MAEGQDIELTARIKADTSDFKKGLDDARKAVKEMRGEADGASASMGRMGEEGAGAASDMGRAVERRGLPSLKRLRASVGQTSTAITRLGRTAQGIGLGGGASVMGGGMLSGGLPSFGGGRLSGLAKGAGIFGLGMGAMSVLSGMFSGAQLQPFDRINSVYEEGLLGDLDRLRQTIEGAGAAVTAASQVLKDWNPSVDVDVSVDPQDVTVHDVVTIEDPDLTERHKGLFDGIRTAGAAALAFLGSELAKRGQEIGRLVSDAGTAAAGVVTGLAEGFADLTRSAHAAVTGLFSDAVSKWDDLFSSAREGLDTLLSGASSALSGAWDAVAGIGSAIAGWFSGLRMPEVFADIADAVGDVRGTITGWFAGLSVPRVFGDIAGKVVDIGGAIAGWLGGVAPAVPGVFGGIYDAVLGIGRTIKDWLGGLEVPRVFADIANTCVDIEWSILGWFAGLSVPRVFGDIAGKVSGIGTDVGKWFSTLSMPGVFGSIQTAVGTIASAIAGWAKVDLSPLTGVFDGILDRARSVYDAIRSWGKTEPEPEPGAGGSGSGSGTGSGSGSGSDVITEMLNSGMSPVDVARELGGAAGAAEELRDSLQEAVDKGEGVFQWAETWADVLSGVNATSYALSGGLTGFETGYRPGDTVGTSGAEGLWDALTSPVGGGDWVDSKETLGLDRTMANVEAVAAGAVAVAAPIAAAGAGLAGAVGTILSWLRGLKGGAVPGFAEGGVFSPNRPQLAVLGDNRTEPEAVAPYSLIVSAVRDALATDRRSEAVDITLQIDGRTLARYVYDDLATEARRRGTA